MLAGGRLQKLGARPADVLSVRVRRVAELAARGVSSREPLGDNSDGLRGFEAVDADGYVLYFGRPA